MRRAAGLLAAAFLCGAAALVLEVVWARYLGLVLGLSAYAVAVVLAGFMLGVALGNWDVGRRLARGQSATKAFVALQVVLAGYMALSPWLYALAGSAARWGDGRAWEAAVALAALIAPSYCVGGTFPTLVAMAEGMRTSRRVGAIYGWNTLGSVAGAWLAGMVLIRHLGMMNTLLTGAGLLALAVCAGLWAMRGAAERENEGGDATAKEDAVAAKIGWAALGVCGVSGLCALACEVLWTRVLTLFFRDSVYDFAIVLMVFLTGIALGGFGAKWLSRRAVTAAHALAWVEVGIGICVIAGLHAVGQLPWWVNDLQTNAAVAQKYGEQFWGAAIGIRVGYAALVILPAALLFGMAFPLAARVWISASAASPARRNIGLLTAINTLGAAAGALLAGYVVVPLIGIKGSLVAAGTLAICAGLGLLWVLWRSNRGMLTAGIFAGTLLLVLSAPEWNRVRMSAGFLGQNQPVEELLDVKFYREDETGITSVLELVPYQQKYLVTNRVYSQNTSDLGGLQDHRRLGLIPMLLHREPKRVLVVGLGAGITLRGVASAGPERVDVAEISEAVVAAAAAEFWKENGRVLEDARVKVHVRDGRNFMAGARGKYEVIVLDILHPMSAGAGSVFSREYFELCRARLAAGGLVCQWLPVHQLSNDSLKTIVRTFRSVFPRMTVWYGLIGERTQVIGLIDGEMNASITAARFGSAGEALKRELHEVNLGSAEMLWSHYVLEVGAAGRFGGEGWIDTDDRPVIEFEAPRLNVESGRQGKLNIVAIQDAAEVVRVSGIDQALWEKQVRGKRAVVEGFRRELAGDLPGKEQAIREAAQKDPDNPDLREWLPK